MRLGINTTDAPRRQWLVWAAGTPYDGSMLRRVVPIILVGFGAALFACGGSDSEEAAGRLVFARDEGVIAYDPSSGDQSLLVPAPVSASIIHPAAAPDGEKLVYVEERTDGEITTGDLYLANADGSGATILREHASEGERVFWPAWLPSSQAVIVSVEVTAGDTTSSSLRLVDVETGAEETLLEFAYHPDVSSDGASLVYINLEEAYGETLWQANVDGSEPHRLLDDLTGVASFFTPRYAPTGDRIAFAVAATEAHESTTGVEPPPLSEGIQGELSPGIWLLPFDGGPPSKVVDLDLSSPSLTWHPDGDKLYVLDSSGLYEVDIDAGEAEQLEDTGSSGNISWLPG
jgi:Tol biopolymer transport system component